MLLEALVPGQVGAWDPQGIGAATEPDCFYLGAPSRSRPEGDRGLWPVPGSDRRQEARRARARKGVGREVGIGCARIVAGVDRRVGGGGFAVASTVIANVAIAGIVVVGVAAIFWGRRIEGSHVD